MLSTPSDNDMNMSTPEENQANLPEAEEQDESTETVAAVTDSNDESAKPAATAAQDKSLAQEQSTTDQPEATSEDTPAEEPTTDDETDVRASSTHESEDDTVTSETEESVTDDGLKRGNLLEGTVLKNTPTEILIDVGASVPGVVNSRELEYLTKNTLDHLQEGNQVWVYVLSPANRAGHPVLSIGRAAEERDWLDAQQYYETKDVFHGKVSGYNKGGLIVRFGRLRGFVPASQISPQRRAKAQGSTPEERWGSMIDDPIVAKVVEIKRSRNRLILSELAAQAEIRAQEKSELVENLEIGEVRTGTVTSLTDFGAFVDIGGADGLVHVTEMSWQHVNHPSEIVSVGDEVTVEVINLDEKNNRIGLSMRTLSEDPWDAIENEYRTGQLTQAKVTKLTKFGAFARLLEHPEIEGLIHVSEMAEHRVKHPREMVNVGDVMTLRIVKIDNEQRRLGLSLKRVDSSQYLDVDWQQADSDMDEF